MANTSQKKPVNDLIKFWADKQEKKDFDPVSRSLRRPLFPNASLPTTPLNESFFQKAPFRDIPTNSPPSTPIKQSNNIHSLISEGNDNSADNGNFINDIQPVNNGTLPRNESPDEEISSHNSSARDVYIPRPRDLDINTRDVLNKDGPLPPARKVTDLVSRFEKVTSPNNSVTTSPRLTPIKQSYPTSPLALSPIKRNKPTPEPLSIPSTINSKTKRRQTVPEPLTISLKKISDEPDLISPISPIGNKRTSPSTEQCVPEVQTQKKPVQQESQSINNNNNNNNNNNTPQIHEKKVSESNPIPKPVILSIKQSDPEPIQPKQTRPASPTIQSDYLDFLTETLQSLQTTSFNSNLWNPENGDKINKTVPEKKSHSQNKKTFTNRKITKVTFDTTSNPNNNKNNTISNSNFEIPDLLPQPEPISPIRLTFSDFIISPNGSSTNLNSNDKQVGEKERLDFLDMMNTKQSDVQKVVKPEVPKKDENYSTTKSMRHISGSNQFIESLRRYLQPNKYKNSDIVNVTTRKVASQ